MEFKHPITPLLPPHPNPNHSVSNQSMAATLPKCWTALDWQSLPLRLWVARESQNQLTRVGTRRTIVQLLCQIQCMPATWRPSWMTPAKDHPSFTRTPPSTATTNVTTCQKESQRWRTRTPWNRAPDWLTRDSCHSCQNGYRRSRLPRGRRIHAATPAAKCSQRWMQFKSLRLTLVRTLLALITAFFFAVEMQSVFNFAFEMHVRGTNTSTHPGPAQ